ncbi:MAG: methyltransferase domain-containing protein [Chloroflexi bacterium]|nr:MAG: methyltransferase domain-containing protein [Chloroflexota bacterium]
MIGLKHHPLSYEKLLLLGEVCQLKSDMRLLDLSCGDGYMLVEWAKRYGIVGVGVDITEDQIADARQYAYEQDVENRLNFVACDPLDYPQTHHEFDVVTCLGHLTLDLDQTLALMQTALGMRTQMLVIGQLYWKELPDAQIIQALDKTELRTLDTMLAHFETQGWQLVEMVLANQDELDRYESSRWMTISDQLKERQRDIRLYQSLKQSQRNYLTYGRRYLGWGAFILRPLHALQDVALPDQHDRPVGVEFSQDMLWVRLADGRVIGNPLVWFPWLMNTEQREDYLFTAAGIEWVSLGKRLTVRQLLNGDVLLE